MSPLNDRTIGHCAGSDFASVHLNSVDFNDIVFVPSRGAMRYIFVTSVSKLKKKYCSSASLL